MRRKRPRVDVRRVILAAVEAALEDAIPETTPKRRRRFPAKQVILVGAGVMAAARVARSGAGRRVIDAVSDRISELGLDDTDVDLDDEELDDELLEDDEE